MGSTNSKVTSGVKAQAAGTTTFELYSLVKMGGGGELVDLMREANKSRNYKLLDQRIQEGVKPFLYNNGEGKRVDIREILAIRSGKTPPDLGNEMKDPEFINKNGIQYKDICWKLDKVGAVGETALHACLLNATSWHADLAKRLLRHFPKLINDIYVSDEYYGENVLHMAIVNEDPAMVKFLIDQKADIHQRCCGNFFLPEDQKGHKDHSWLHEWFDLPVNTNYYGFTYWGEYPLGFAACLGQEECVRLLEANGADPNVIDSNGNTTLHCLVIHDQIMRERAESGKYSGPEEMFDLLVELGAKLHIKNRQELTPLTLAAKLARKELYEHILKIESEQYWTYNDITCAAYPLDHIDTISKTGDINTNSAMYHILYGDKPEHIDMIEGLVGHLLDEKWKTFAKFRFFRRFIMFIFYFIIFVIAVYLRPGTDIYAEIVTVNRTNSKGISYMINNTVKNPCYLLRYKTSTDYGRLFAELCTILGALIYIFLSLKEVYNQGFKIFFQTLESAPAKAMFLMANFFVLLMLPGRAACSFTYEDVMGVMAILFTAPYFLFFCRGFKLVGPFVVMIYKMVKTDLLRFFSIYLVFVIGFSQTYYIMYRDKAQTMFSEPAEAVMAMFIMNLAQFADLYESFEQFKELHYFPKVVFFIFMTLVTLLLVNMLIAMMANTYQVVSETQKEWLRQWAKIIVVIEQTVTIEERHRQQINYSRPMKDGRRALVIKWHQSDKEKEELKAEKEEFDSKYLTYTLKNQNQNTNPNPSSNLLSPIVSS